MTPSQKPQDGGAAPAFPVTAGNNVFATGANLRDWFAAQALPAAALIAMDMPVKEASPAPTAARLAYELADAMLAAREAQP